MKPKQSKDDGDAALHPLQSIHITHPKSLSGLRSDGQICVDLQTEELLIEEKITHDTTEKKKSAEMSD